MKLFILTLVMIGISAVAPAQQSKMTREDYISKYKSLAVKEMERTGIPASITMAQGLLESGNGNSRLAVKANNHFGVKCHEWNGKKIRHDDDANRECFRKYGSVEESYRDHSDFLTSKSRYADLFKLSSTDYKGWARELKRAGYATSPTYAEALIKIIEENRLYLLDEGVDLPDRDELLAIRSEKEKSSVAGKGAREILENNRVKYVLARAGDTYNGLTEELEMLPWQLSRYNELPQEFEIAEGQVIYIQPKRVNSDDTKTVHTVNKGETMYAISQKYAVRLDKLYLRNFMQPGTEAEPGTKLLLRGRNGNTKVKPVVKPGPETEEQEEMQFEFDLD